MEKCIIRRILIGLVCLCLCHSSDFIDCASESRNDSVRRTPTIPPHVILIIADDLGFNDVSFHGSPQIPTPNIDALAYSGVILNSYYVSPICTPSRSALFTGKHPIHTGMQHDVIYGSTPYGLPLTEKLLPEYLKEKGFATHLVGKWHLGHFRRNYTPLSRGFDSHFGHWTGHKDYYDNFAEESRPQAWGYDMRRGYETTRDGFGTYTTDLYTEEAKSILQNHNASIPIFLTISHTAVHSANPYQLLQAPKATVDNYTYIKDVNRRTFAAMVAKLDESIGEVVSALSSRKMLQDSIIIFTTDNGGPAAGFNGNAASNWPLRGVKNTLFEGGVRGAGFIWSPLIVSTSRVSNDLMHIQDWLPTLMSAIGEDSSVLGDIDGLDMWETISSGVSSPRTQMLHNIDDSYGNEGVRMGDWKLLHGTTYKGKWDGWYGPSGQPSSKLMTNTVSAEDYEDLGQEKDVFPLIVKSPAGKALKDLEMLPSEITMYGIQREATVDCKLPQLPTNVTKCNLLSGEFCLFNVKEDPCEYNNVAKTNPDIVQKLKEALQQYRKSSVPPGNKPKDLRGLPRKWGYTWTNWMDYLEPE